MKESKKYYINLDTKSVTDNKKFWSTMKPFFSHKGVNNSTITLIEGDNIISEDLELANTLNNFFRGCSSISKYSHTRRIHL